MPHRSEPPGPALATTLTLGPAPPSGSLDTGAQLGHFTIVRLLGAGGMGAVYEARDLQLDRRVAIKVLAGDMQREDLHARLVREAQALAQLQHPNVVGVHEVGVAQGRVFLTMELVDGMTLDQHLQSRPHTWREIVSLFVQAGRGLAAAHAKGLVHRDFKPGNVLVDRDGRVRVGDFGLVRLDSHDGGVPDDVVTAPGTRAVPAFASDGTTIDSGAEATEAPAAVPRSGAGDGPFATPLTHANAFLGTPRYMAPEQYARQPATARSDQYGFCVSLWEALFDQLPFTAPSLDDAPAAVGRLRTPPRGRAPRALVRLLARGLDPVAGRRHPSMTALVAALEALPLRRRRLAVAGAGVLIAAAAAFGAVAATGGDSIDCARAGQGVDALWTGERRADLGTRFAAARPYGADSAARVAAALDTWTGQWRDARVDACRATHVRGEQSAELLDRRTACLDRGRLALSALVTGLSTVDGPTVDRALDAVRGLPSPDDCTAAHVGSDAPRPTAPGALAIEQDLQTGEALWNLGRRDDSTEHLERAVRDARAFGDSALLARGLALHGRASIRRSPPKARALLEEALVAAAQGNDPGAEADAALSLLEEATFIEDAARIGALLPGARAASATTGRDQHVRRLVALEIQASIVLGQRADAALCDRVASLKNATALDVVSCRCRAAQGALRRDEIFRYCQELVDADTQHYGPDHPAAVEPLHSIAAAHHQVGHEALALELFAKVVDRAEKAYGRDSQVVARALFATAVTLSDINRHAEARATYEAAIAIMQRIDERPTVDLARALVYLAHTLSNMGLYEEATRRAEEGIRTVEETLGPQHRRLASLLLSYGAILGKSGRHDEAASILRRGEEISERHFGANHDRTLALVMQGAQELTRAGRPADAIAPAQRALDGLLKVGTPYNIGVAHGILGEALARSGQRERGSKELLEALRIFRSRGDASRDEQNEVEAKYKEIFGRAAPPP